MVEIRTVSTLYTKRYEIIRSIESYEAKLDQARVDLSHINAVIVLFEHNPDQMLDYKPCSSTAKLFRYGELAKLCWAALEAGEMTRLGDRGQDHRSQGHGRSGPRIAQDPIAPDNAHPQFAHAAQGQQVHGRSEAE